MARAFWKGAISFGLVYIPVELYSATPWRIARSRVPRSPRLRARRLPALQQADRQARRMEGHRTRLPVSEGTLRRAVRGRLPPCERQGLADDRDRSLRGCGEHRAPVFRDSLLRRRAERWPEGVCAAARGAQADPQGGDRDRRAADAPASGGTAAGG